MIYEYVKLQREVQGKISKKGKTEEHPRSLPSGPYAVVHNSKLNYFLGFYAQVHYAQVNKHLCIFQIMSMHM